MESKSHFLVHFIPGMLLGSVVGLAFGSLLVASQIPQTKQTSQAVASLNQSCSSIKDLSVKTMDGKNFDILLGGKSIYEIHALGLYNAGNFYKINQSSNFAYLQLSPDGLGGYILYNQIFNLYRIDLCSGKAVALLDTTGAGHGGSFDAKDISPDEKYLVGIFSDVGLNAALRVQSITDESDVKDFLFPSEDYGTFDAKFSPDGSKIAVVAAHGDPSNELGILWIFDRKTGKFSGYMGNDNYLTPKGDVWVIKGWTDNQTVDVEKGSVEWAR